MNPANSVFVQFVHPLIGASPGWGGAQRLYHIVGRQRAITLACGSKRLYLEDGLNCGFLDAPMTSLEDCELFLHQFTGKEALGSVDGIKRAIAANEYLNSDGAKVVELEVFKNRWFSEDNIKALASKK
jgi:enoyl-CoA hydratase/carnithine racemase